VHIPPKIKTTQKVHIVPKMHRFLRYSTSKMPWPWKPG